jgi:hypothetical protein
MHISKLINTLILLCRKSEGSFIVNIGIGRYLIQSIQAMLK